jgi:uncharacterized protein YndB with AHSA1/START domain
MLEVIAIIAAVVGIAVAAILLIAATKPDTFAIQRTATIRAPAETIFPLIDDLRAQSAWSPFEKDPAMKRTHSGAAAGKGAVYEWDGNRQVGRGRIEIVESKPSSSILLKLDMFTPFEAHNMVEFTLTPNGSGTDVATDVTWAMQGRQPYMAKVFSTIVNCDRMVGGQFEEGLAKLKALVERQATPQTQ